MRKLFFLICAFWASLSQSEAAEVIPLPCSFDTHESIFSHVQALNLDELTQLNLATQLNQNATRQVVKGILAVINGNFNFCSNPSNAISNFILIKPPVTLNSNCGAKFRVTPKSGQLNKLLTIQMIAYGTPSAGTTISLHQKVVDENGKATFPIVFTIPNIPPTLDPSAVNYFQIVVDNAEPFIGYFSLDGGNGAGIRLFLATLLVTDISG